MNEPTIQELIDDLVTSSGLYQEAVPGEEERVRNDDLQSARSALLSHITQIQQENKGLWEALTKIKEITIELTVMNSALKNVGDMPERSTKNFYSEIKRMSGLIFDITALQREAESAKTDYELLSDDYTQISISHDIQFDRAEKAESEITALQSENKKFHEALVLQDNLCWEWDSNKLGDIQTQKKRWLRLGKIAQEALK